MDKRSLSKCNFSGFRQLAWKLIKFLRSVYKPWVGFSLNFALPFSVMTHNSSEIFQLKHYMLWTKTAHQKTTFQTVECFNEDSPSCSCHFWNHKVKFYSNFTSLFSVMKITSLYFFSSKYFGQKESIEVKFPAFSVVGWTFTKFLMLYLKSKVSFSLNFGSLFNVIRDNSCVLF